MHEMETWLRDLGFEVMREYDKNKVGYHFEITKKNRNGVPYGHASFFQYPENVSDGAKDRLQRIFLENLVDDFYRAWPDISRDEKPGIDYAKYIRERVFVDKPNTKRMVGCYEGIQNVIFNYPATIVFWTDGTKTVVKAQPDDKWDPEKGLAMAIVKKAYGNKGNYCNEVKRWLPKTAEEAVDYISDGEYAGLDIGDAEYKKYDTLKAACQRLSKTATKMLEELS